MFDWKKFNNQLCVNILATLILASAGCAVIAMIYAVIMLPGLVSGKWAFVHVLAMLGMMSAFAVLAGCFSTLYDAACRYFRKEVRR